MSNKIKRKITVSLNTQKSKTQTNTRPSVFDRLGIKSVAGSTTLKEYCHPWAQNGSCPYGKGCKYSKTHTLISPSKQRAAKIQTEPKKRHAKEGHKRINPGEPENWDQWGPDELEDADPDDLERKRQELQRELELQMKMEHKARKKEKKGKKESSPSSDSSSTSSDSSSSSDDSSSTSTSSLDTRHKKLKKIKTKRASSSSSEGRSRKPKKPKHISKSATRDKSKKPKPNITKIVVKSPSPVRIRKKSETPPIKPKLTLKKDTSETKSPRPLSRLSDRKEKHCTPSPRTLREKEREKEREREKEKEREREREREKEKEREREREREKEREKERERERERERVKQREKEREREKKKDSRSPKRDNRVIKDIKRRESPDSSHSRDRKFSPGRAKPSTSKRDRTPDRREKRDERARSRGKDRIIDKSRKDKRDSRDRERDREREREKRLREEREAAREKEREEALARCQERQRERERLKELEKKDSDRRGRDRVRRDDKGGLDKPSGDRVERLLPLPEDRLPPSRRHSPDRDRADRRDGRGHSVDTRKSARNSPDRHDRVDRDVHDRSYDRERGYDREHEDRGREYGMTGRIRDDRRLDDKNFDSPFDRNRHDERRYMEMDDHYSEGPRDDRLPLDGREYVDDRRDPRREIWDMRDERVDIERNLASRGRGYGRPDGRAPGHKGRGDWVEPDYPEHEWDNRGRRPLDWENREGWDGIDRPHPPEEEWRHYDRGMENWTPNDNRRRWPNNRNNDWRDNNRDNNSRPRSAASHNVEATVTEDSNADPRKKEVLAAPQPRPEATVTVEPADSKQAVESTEPEEDLSVTAKRPAEDSPDGAAETKKICIKPEPAPVLEDDLSEISDDADDILNRDEFIVFQDILEEAIEDPLHSTTAEPESQPSASEVPSATASQKSQSPQRSPAKSTQKDDSIDDDNMDLVFEEISEDELDEESKVKGIGDALGVDWASLVAESRPREKPMTSAKLRWEPHNILVNLGISVNFAGEDLVKAILREHAEAEIKLEAEEKVQAKIKTESVEVNINGIKQEIKDEPDDVFKEPKEDVKLDHEDINISHPIAAIQVSNLEAQQIRRTLFTSVGPHRRALSARRDLMIRRHLCNLPINDSYVEAPKRHDPELFKIATQLFERCL